MNLTKLKALAAFDEVATHEIAKHEDSGGYFGFLAGAAHENTRLQPLVTLLLEIVEKQDAALKFYAEVFPMPMEVIAKNKEDSKFAEISTALLNEFHTTANLVRAEVARMVEEMK